MRVNTKKPKIVVIGGGTGSFVVLSSLRNSGFEVTAIVNVTDSGGSSGILRDELGVLPPGDVRQCLVALSHAREPLRELFAHRFRKGTFSGHAFGNLFLTACEDLTGSFTRAVELASRVLQIQGRVLPVTLDRAELCATLGNGKLLYGEDAITNSVLFKKFGIRRLFLKPPASAYGKAVEAIKSANLIIMAPGNLYSSLIPNLLVRGIPEAITKSRGRKVCLASLMTKKGQTDGFYVHDFKDEMEHWAGRPLFDTVIYNTEIPPAAILARYARDGSPVRFDQGIAARHTGAEFIGKSLLSKKFFRPRKEDPLYRQRSLIRHDPEKLAKVLASLL